MPNLELCSPYEKAKNYDAFEQCFQTHLARQKAVLEYNSFIDKCRSGGSNHKSGALSGGNTPTDGTSDHSQTGGSKFKEPDSNGKFPAGNGTGPIVNYDGYGKVYWGCAGACIDSAADTSNREQNQCEVRYPMPATDDPNFLPKFNKLDACANAARNKYDGAYNQCLQKCAVH